MIQNVWIVEWGPFEDWKLINGSGTMTIRRTSSALFYFSYSLVSPFHSSLAFSFHRPLQWECWLVGILLKTRCFPTGPGKDRGVHVSPQRWKNTASAGQTTLFLRWNLVKHGVIQLSWHYTEVTFVQIFNPERVRNILATKRMFFHGDVRWESKHVGCLITFCVLSTDICC